MAGAETKTERVRAFQLDSGGTAVSTPPPGLALTSLKDLKDPLEHCSSLREKSLLLLSAAPHQEHKAAESRPFCLSLLMVFHF